MTAAQAPVRIGLWGATQVGKTALLATALYQRDPALASLKLADGASSINQHLLHVHVELMNNRWVPPTAVDSMAISLRGKDDRPLELIDVRGSFTLDVGAPGRREAVRGCDAMLFLAEYSGQTTGDQISAIDAALVEIDQKPVALALTKCERWLLKEDPKWNRPKDWLQGTPLWTAHERALRRFADVAWPTSAFGYDKTSGFPAVILGEMGQAIPFRIQPRNVAQPLAWLMRALDCL